MLVKLGTLWVDPIHVIKLDYLQIESKIIIGFDTGDAAITDGEIDEFASIINNAGQSYGGSDETPEGK